MVEMSATPASIAARHSVTEQAVQWLLENRGGGDGDGETAELLKRLYRALVAGAVASGTWHGEEPWEDTLIYDGADTSMHLTVFGLSGSNAVRCQDGKGFYGRVFSDNELRWQSTGQYYASSLANDIFGTSNSGYLDRIRSQNLQSLAQAVFKTSANIASGKTIIDRIATVQTAVDELADNVQQAIEDQETNLNTFKVATNNSVTNILERLSTLEQRVTNAGIP
ncbi:hypothetical protein U8P71_17155 [Rhizobium ruizarguesonis]|nr:hypothetical protein U8P71_17155 [Rhizobium ruizarguesonis]